MNKINKNFSIARLVAMSEEKEVNRKFRVGAVGIRNDGVMVACSNICTRTPNKHAHAEARLVRKLTPKSIVYVVRIDSNGEFRNARPCENCSRLLSQKKVKKVYYSINEQEYGVIDI